MTNPEINLETANLDTLDRYKAFVGFALRDCSLVMEAYRTDGLDVPDRLTAEYARLSELAQEIHMEINRRMLASMPRHIRDTDTTRDPRHGNLWNKWFWLNAPVTDIVTLQHLEDRDRGRVCSVEINLTSHIIAGLRRAKRFHGIPTN